MSKAFLMLADGFEEIEAVSVVDILRRADIEVTTVSIMKRKEVEGGHQITVMADVLFEDTDFSLGNMLILPGGLQGTKGLAEHAGLKQVIEGYEAQGKWLAAICAAPTLLGGMGLLKGKTAICYPGNEHILEGATTEADGPAVVDGNVITSRGPGTSFDFAFTIVERLKGKETADTLKEKMIVSV